MSRGIVVAQVRAALALLGFSVLGTMRATRRKRSPPVGRGTSRNAKNEGLGPGSPAQCVHPQLLLTPMRDPPRIKEICKVLLEVPGGQPIPCIHPKGLEYNDLRELLKEMDVVNYADTLPGEVVEITMEVLHPIGRFVSIYWQTAGVRQLVPQNMKDAFLAQKAVVHLPWPILLKHSGEDFLEVLALIGDGRTTCVLQVSEEPLPDNH